MQTDLPIFAHAIVKRRRFPALGEEHHADGLAEVVELEACGANSGED